MTEIEIIPQRTEEEKLLFEALENLQKQYEKAASPYINRLTQIQESKELRFVMSLEEFKRNFMTEFKYEE